MLPAVKQSMHKALTFWQGHSFVVMIVGVIIIAGVLVSIAMHMYNTSGAAQVDLSRPGFQEVRVQATRTDTTETYAAEGKITKEVLNDFKKTYQERRTKITNNAFDPAVLSDESLQIFPNTVDQGSATNYDQSTVPTTE